MPIVQAKCENCGGVLAVDNSLEAAVCPFCNTPYIVEKAVNNYSITNNINIGEGAIVNIVDSKGLEIEGGGLYTGDSIGGKPHGFGKAVYSKGDSYEGEWAFGKYNGQGTKIYNDSTYVGEWKNGEKNGHGKLIWNKGEEWNGEFKDDKPWDGNGVWYYTDVKYIGAFKNGLKNGQGKLIYNKGGEWNGEFKDGVSWNGEGVLYDVKINPNDKYIGSYKNGKRNGQGKLITNNGEDWWIGEFKDGDFWNGEGEWLVYSGLRYKRKKIIFRNGKQKLF